MRSISRCNGHAFGNENKGCWQLANWRAFPSIINNNQLSSTTLVIAPRAYIWPIYVLESSHIITPSFKMRCFITERTGRVFIILRVYLKPGLNFINPLSRCRPRKKIRLGKQLCTPLTETMEGNAERSSGNPGKFLYVFLAAPYSTLVLSLRVSTTV